MSGTFFVILILLAVVAIIVRKPRRAKYEDEPWRASLNEEDEPLDMEEARRAEEEWENEGGLEWEEDEEGWSG